MILISTKIWIF